MNPAILALLMFVGVLVLVLSGVPLAFALGSLGLIFGLVGDGYAVLPLFINRIYGLMSNPVMPAIPLFIFMGFMLERSGSTENLYESLYKLMGGFKGGLAIATIIICTLFAACTGVIGASIVTMGLIALPPMLKRNYNKSVATGSIMAGGTLGIIIPPSIILILYGPIANLSVARLFMAALMPGLLLSALYIIYILIISYLNPDYCPAMSKEERQNLDKKKLIKDLLIYALPPLLLILLVLGSIFFGVVATTEAAALGAFGSIILTVCYKKFSWKIFVETSVQTLKTSTMVLFVALGATLFVGTFILLGGSELLVSTITGLTIGKWVILAFMMLTILFLGMFIDWVGILYIVVPIFTPIIINLGFNPLWFATLVCVNLQASFLTPPFAYSMFFLKSVSPESVKMMDIYKGSIPFIVLQLIGLLLIILFPQIVLWLPSVLF